MKGKPRGPRGTRQGRNAVAPDMPFQPDRYRADATRAYIFGGDPSLSVYTKPDALIEYDIIGDETYHVRRRARGVLCGPLLRYAHILTGVIPKIYLH